MNDKPRSGQWECGNRESDFQGRWKVVGNLLLVFHPLSIRPSFPLPSGGALHCSKQALLGLLHAPCGFGVAHAPRCFLE